MKRLMLLFILLVIAVVLGIWISRDPGYLLIGYQQWTIEMPLWLGGVVILLSFTVLHLLLRFSASIKLMMSRLQAWFRRRRKSLSRKKTSNGLIALNEGNWQLAERLLVQGANESEVPLINYLAAARAAQEQGLDSKRDKYLRIAQESTPDSSFAVELTQAELQINHGQLEQALASLRHLHTLAPRHPYVIKLLHDIYVQVSDWQQAANLLPSLKRYHILSDQGYQAAEEKIYFGLIEQKISENNVDALSQFWDGLPKHIKLSPELAYQYTLALHLMGADDVAAKVVKQVLNKHWDARLVALFGQLNSGDSTKQLKIAEKWLISHPDDAPLLLSLGRICSQNQLWGKAKTYLESALAISPEVEIYAELGRLVEQMDTPDAAIQYYREGIQLSLGQRELIDTLVLTQSNTSEQI